MSPIRTLRANDPEHFPRVSGDEPATFDQIKGSWRFSPRERG